MLNKMPKGDSTAPTKNKFNLTINEIPKDATEQNHSENGYVKK